MGYGDSKQMITVRVRVDEVGRHAFKYTALIIQNKMSERSNSTTVECRLKRKTVST